MKDADREFHLRSLDRETWVCYECLDDNCEHCIGVPCDCPCEVTEPREFEPEYFI